MYNNLKPKQIPSPFENEQDFEDFILHYFNELEKTNSYSPVGRRGQLQHGMDVYSHEKKTVIQCKLKILDLNDDKKIRSILLSELEKDFYSFVEYNKQMDGHYTKFIFASTYKEDFILSSKCNELSNDSLSVEYWSWKKIINQAPSQIYKEINIESSTKLQAYYDNSEIHKSKKNTLTKDTLKKEFPKPLNYIERKLYLVNDSTPTWLKEKLSVIEEIKSKKYVTILGIAGSGKSVELEYLAYHFNAKEPDYQVIKVKLNGLASNNDIKSFITIEYPEFQNDPNECFIILLDGLDEVPQKKIGDTSKQISNLAKEFINSLIVVSCRNNFYTIESERFNARISGFSTYGFHQLSQQDVRSYCQKLLKMGAKVFRRKISESKVQELIGLPFYLVKLVEYFQDKNDLPASRNQIYEYLINLRIEEDIINKYQNTGLLLDESQEIIKYQIEKLAISSELLGKNNLTSVEVNRLVEKPNLIEMIKYSFLFDKNSEGNWQFEHNNFQEYLAARFLTKLSLKEIKEFISFSPDYTKIKPTWINTTSFLLSLLQEQQKNKFEALLDWLKSVEPSVLIQFESDKIELSQREEIFKTIYEDFENKGILINSNNFNEDDLSNFVSDSKKIAEFLLLKLNDITKPWKLSEAIRLLCKLQVASEYLAEIENEILLLISREDIPNEHKLGYFENLKDLNIYSDEITERILQEVDINSSNYLRAGYYAYLINDPRIDKDISELITNGISKLQEPRVLRNANDNDVREVHLSSEKNNLERLIKRFNNFQNTIKLIKWAQSIRDFDHNTTYKSLVELTISNATKLFIETANSKIYDEIFKLLLNMSRRYLSDLTDEFNNFFVQTGNSIMAFNAIRNNYLTEGGSTIDLYHALSSVANDECVDLIIDEFSKGTIADNHIYIYIQAFNYRSNKSGNYFRQRINKLSGNKFLQRSSDDYEESRLNRLKNDCSLLLNKERLKKQILNVFDMLEKDSLTKNEFWNLRDRSLEELSIDNNVVLDTLRTLIRSKDNVDRNSINKLFNSEKSWYWYQTHELIQIDINNEKFEIADELSEHWIMWLESALLKANFNSTVFINKEGEIVTNYLEHFIIYIANRIDYSLPETTYLDFLFLDPSFIPIKKDQNRVVVRDNNITDQEILPNHLNEYVVEKIGLEKASERIVDNINNNTLVSANQKINHCKFCSEHGLIEGASLIKELLSGSKELVQNEIDNLIEWYLELADDTRFVESLLSSLDEYNMLKATHCLLKRNSLVALNSIKKEIDNNEVRVDYFFRLLETLSNTHPQISFKYLKDWILKNKRLPNRSYFSLKLEGANLSDLIILYENAVVNNYGTSIFSSRDIFLSKMIELSIGSFDEYNLLRNKLFEWIEKFDELSLYSQIQKLELEYYSKLSQIISLEEIINLLKK